MRPTQVINAVGVTTLQHTLERISAANAFDSKYCGLMATTRRSSVPKVAFLSGILWQDQPPADEDEESRA